MCDAKRSFKNSVHSLDTSSIEHYLLVIVPGVCMHMLDMGLDHMPNNHIVTTPPPQLLPNAHLFQVMLRQIFNYGEKCYFIYLYF